MQVLFAFRLFSFVITDAGTQLRKYLAAAVTCAHGSRGRIFLFNDCAFVYLHQREFFSVRIHNAEAASRIATIFTDSQQLRAKTLSMRNEIPFFFHHISDLRSTTHRYTGRARTTLLFPNVKSLVIIF